MRKELSEQYLERINNVIDNLPPYVHTFLYNKRNLTASTRYKYSCNLNEFFSWYAENVLHKEKIKSSEITLMHLNDMKVSDVELYLSNLKLIEKKSNTINNKLATLKSLFNYLHLQEDHEQKSILPRNVMLKIEAEKKDTSLSANSNKIKAAILYGDEYEEFKQFVAEGYGKLKLHHVARKYYDINRERDIAIISLFLGSGIRLSELAGLNIEDIDTKNMMIKVYRKGSKVDYVNISQNAFIDLIAYLDIRTQRYKPNIKNTSVFFSAPQAPTKSDNRLSTRAIELVVEKYAKAFGRPNLTAHKLRHSFGTRHYQENKDPAGLQMQLGHESGNTTMMYTHIMSNTLRESVDKVD